MKLSLEMGLGTYVCDKVQKVDAVLVQRQDVLPAFSRVVGDAGDGEEA